MNQQQAQQQFQSELFDFQKKTAYHGTVPDNFSDWIQHVLPKYSPAKLNFPVEEYETVFYKKDGKYNLYQLANLIWMLDQQTPNDMAMVMEDYLSFVREVHRIAAEITTVVEPEVTRIQRKMQVQQKIANPNHKQIPIGKVPTA